MSVIFVRLETNLNAPLIYVNIPAVSKILMKRLSVFFELLRRERDKAKRKA